MHCCDPLHSKKAPTDGRRFDPLPALSAPALNSKAAQRGGGRRRGRTWWKRGGGGGATVPPSVLTCRLGEGGGGGWSDTRQKKRFISFHESLPSLLHPLSTPAGNEPHSIYKRRGGTDKNGASRVSPFDFLFSLYHIDLGDEKNNFVSWISGFHFVGRPQPERLSLGAAAAAQEERGAQCPVFPFPFGFIRFSFLSLQPKDFSTASEVQHLSLCGLECAQCFFRNLEK